MKVERLINTLGADFFTGVPDSQLKELCNYLMDKYGIDSQHHIIAANEGNCVGLAAGYHLATGKVPVVYMQNSGEGNIINPVASLLNDKVYAIPMIFIIGWRGEPGVHDEPQHIYQGEVTLKLLENMDISYFVIDKDTSEEELNLKMDEFRLILDRGKQVALVVRKGALADGPKVEYKSDYLMSREEIIKRIAKVADEDAIVSTTGKASRELFEIRTSNNQSHKFDFLTVGSMGHSSSIALGVAINKPDKKIWCIDGDGAALMHMGAMAVVGSTKASNLIHVVINNGAHESVGGMPTVAKNVDFVLIARACGYEYSVSVSTYEELDDALKKAKISNSLSFVEVKCAIGARENLGRPTISTLENKENMMHFLSE